MNKNIGGLSSSGFAENLFGAFFFDMNTGLAVGEGGTLVRTSIHTPAPLITFLDYNCLSLLLYTILSMALCLSFLLSDLLSLPDGFLLSFLLLTVEEDTSDFVDTA